MFLLQIISILALTGFILLIAFYEIYKISANASQERNNAHTYGHSDLDGNYHASTANTENEILMDLDSCADVDSSDSCSESNSIND